MSHGENSFDRLRSAPSLGCCGLAGFLPPLQGDSATAMQVAQYDALKAGTAVGGNYERFLDAVAQGWFTNDKAGYANYMAWNSRGLSSPEYKNQPEFAGWQLAANGAYAVANKMHQSNYSSPLYDPQFASDIGYKSIRGMATNQGWTDAQKQAAEASFAEALPRLLTAFGYTGSTTTAAPKQQIKNPFFASLGQTVWVDASTVTYDGPDHDPATASRGGREFSAGGTTWRWGASAPAKAQPIKMAELVLSKAKSPGDGIHFAVVGWRLQDIDPSSRVALKSYGWTRWDGLSNRLSSETTKQAFLEDITDEVQRGNTLGDGRYAAYWDWANLQAMLGRSGPGSPPPTNVGIDVLAAPNSNSLTPNTLPPGQQQTGRPNVPPPVPSGTTPPWSDVAVPPPSQGSQPTIPPGVPPVETITGTLMPSIVAPGMPPMLDDAGADGSEPAQASVGPSLGGKGALMLAGLGLLLIGWPKGRFRR